MALYTRGNTRRSLIDTISFRLVSQVATILGYIVMVRAMSKEDFGIFNLLYAFIPVVSTIASFGLEQTLRRYQPEYLRAGNTGAAAWLFRFVRSTRFGANVLVLGVLLLAWNHVAPIFKLAPYRAEFAFFCLLILLHFQTRILQLSLASHMMHRYSVGSIVVLAVAKLLAYSLLAWHGELTLDSAIFADVLGYLLMYTALAVAHRKQGTAEIEGVPFRPEPSERRRLLRYGMFNNFNDAGTLVLSTRSDNFFIAALVDPVAVGAYAFYTRLNEMVANLLPGRIFENVIQPLFFAVSPAHAQRKVPEYFSLLIDLNLVLQWPMLAFAVAYHAEIVGVIFGGKFIESSWLLPLIVAFTTFHVISLPVSLVAQYEEKAHIILWSKVFAVYNVVTMLIFLPWAGLYGAALSSGSAQLFKNLFIWWHVRRRAVWMQFGAVFLCGLSVWGAVVVLCYLLKTLVPAPAVIQLLMGAALCALALLLYLRTPAITETDRAILASILHGKEARLLRRIGLLRAPVARKH